MSLTLGILLQNVREKRRFYGKTEAAKENGVECIIIKRPTDESGMTVSEVEKMILEWL